MFDTMKITMGVAAVCGGLLVFLLGGWAASALYDIDHHGYDHVRGYTIDTGGDDSAVQEEVIEVAFADVYATADAAAGERLYRACAACHSLEPGINGVGPYLHGVVDREKHTAQGYGYSDALLQTTGAWTPETISDFIENPREYAPGTAMAYNGMRDIEDRANLIAYLATFQ